MPLPDVIRNSGLLRWPLLALAKMILKPLHSGPPLLRRAAYDSLPTQFVVTSAREQFIVATHDKVIGRALFLHGEFDLCKLEIALAILKREGLYQPDHMIDVGANVGSITIPALARGWVKTASAIEPHPENLRLLKANLELNGVADRTRVYPIAVGDASHVALNLCESQTNSGNHSIARQGLPVQSMRLDDLGLPSENSLLWMDIEGYEGHALAGAASLVASGMPIVSEFNPRYLQDSGGIDLLTNGLIGRRLFDLSAPEETGLTLDTLVRRCKSGFTDILAIT